MAAVLELKGVTKRFGSKSAVDNVSIKLNPGEIYGFLGPNGAGKTTTIRMIMDFIRPTSGNVKLFGKNVYDNAAGLFGRVGYLSADSVLYPNWNARQHVDYVKQVRGSSNRAEKLIERFGLDTQAKYGKLSSGNKQKLALVLSMMSEPDLLILDEPTRGLDPLLQQELYSLLLDFKKAGGTVFMSSHNLSEVQKVCDHIGIIRAGKLVASETMDSLRKMHVHCVTIQFEKQTNTKEFELSNVEIVKSSKTELVANIRGDLNELMSLVARHKVRDIEITHVSVEEMFMRYYQ